MRRACKAGLKAAVAGVVLLGTGAAGAAGDVGYYTENRYAVEPDEADMLADLVAVRPMMVVATAVGAVGWILALPFTALGGNVEEVGQKMVVEPAKYTFLRPLGHMEEGTRPIWQTSRTEE